MLEVRWRQRSALSAGVLHGPFLILKWKMFLHFLEAILQTPDETNPTSMKAFSSAGFLSVLNPTLTQRCQRCFCFQMEREAGAALRWQVTHVVMLPLPFLR